MSLISRKICKQSANRTSWWSRLLDSRRSRISSGSLGRLLCVTAIGSSIMQDLTRKRDAPELAVKVGFLLVDLVMSPALVAHGLFVLRGFEQDWAASCHLQRCAGLDRRLFCTTRRIADRDPAWCVITFGCENREKFACAERPLVELVDQGRAPKSNPKISGRKGTDGRH